MTKPGRICLYVSMAAMVAFAALPGCDCEDQARKLVQPSQDRKIAARTEPTQVQRLTETEPNDDPKQATPLELRGERRPVYGEISTPQDVDWFVVTVDDDEPWSVELSVTPVDAALNLALHLEVPGEPDVPPLRYNLGEAGLAESIPVMTVSRTPTRFFIAGVDGTTGEYEIRFSRQLAGGSVEAEPNDYPHVATSFQIPGELQGFYDRPGDRDIYHVAADLLSDDVYSLEVSNIVGLAQTVRVFDDPSLQAPILSLHVPPSAPASIPNVSFPRTGAGLWFVFTAHDGYDRKRGYRLRLIKHPTDEGFVLEREPNNTPETAQRIEIGQTIQGYLHDAEDVDRYRLVIEAPESVEDTEESEPVPTSVVSDELEGDEATVDEELVEEANPFAGVAEKVAPLNVLQIHLTPLAEHLTIGMRWLPPAVGTQQPTDLTPSRADQPLVFCNFEVGSGDYDVEVRSVEARPRGLERSFDYRLSTTNIAQTKGLEIEPNNTPEEADRLEAGVPRVGYIGYTGDVDVYAFYVAPDPVAVLESPATDADVENGDGEISEADIELVRQVLHDSAPAPQESQDPKRVRLHLKGNALNLQFRLNDDEGGVIANVNHTGPGADEQLAIDLPPGLYFVHVSATRGFVCEPYELTVHHE